MTQTGMQRGRRWIAGVATLVLLAAAWYVVPRLGARSPVAILVICAMAVLVMKLVERRIHQWVKRWEQKAKGVRGYDGTTVRKDGRGAKGTGHSADTREM